MKGLYKVLIGILCAIIGILIVLCGVVLLYSVWGTGSTDNDMGTKKVSIDKDEPVVTLPPDEPTIELYILGEDLCIDKGVYNLFGFRNGMTFEEAMKLVLDKTGKSFDEEENVADYEGVYYTTYYNSTDCVEGSYDNIEISTDIEDFYFEGVPVNLNFKFVSSVGNDDDSVVSDEDRLNARLKEVRLRFVLDEQSTEDDTLGENLKNNITAVLGEPEMFLDKDVRRSYRWYYNDEVLMISYYWYSDGDYGAEDDCWILDYIALRHFEIESVIGEE